MQTIGTMLTIIGSLNIFLLGLLLYQIKGLREDIRSICDELDSKTDTRIFERETGNLWKRMHGHKHDEKGNVIVMARRE